MTQLFRQIGSFFILCVLTLSVAAQDEDAVLLKRTWSISFQNISLEQALTRLSDKTGVNFSYDPSLIDLDARINNVYTDRNLGFILSDLLGSEFVFQQLGNQLVIKLKDSPFSGVPDLPDNDFRLIRGRLLDRDYGDVIPYASISVQDQAFGTITNKEGNFELKLPPKYQHESLVFSCMGYARQVIPADSIAGDSLVLRLRPVNIRLKEIKVKAINAQRVLEQMLEHIPDNYPEHTELMTAFYREVLTQDGVYINVSEAVIQLLKASYSSAFQDDKIRFLKGRKSKEVETFQWVDFKMQGGPYYTAQLDLIKTRDNFLDENYREIYKYESAGMIDYLGRPTYVLQFTPEVKMDELTYEGKLYIDEESFALVKAEFSIARSGIRAARDQLIRKKPKGFNVRALNLDYSVSYRLNQGKWYLHAAQSSVSFRVRSRQDRVNSVFHSVSDLLVTSHEGTRLRRFPKDEQLRSSDIFTELITDYDPRFWGNYNIIQPTDELQKAIKSLAVEETKPNIKNQPNQP